MIAICMLVIAACAAAQPQQTVGEASPSDSALASPSESGLPSAFASAQATKAVNAVESAQASKAVDAAASDAASSTPVMAASPDISVSVASGEIVKTVDKIIDVNALNSVFASDPKLEENGEQMVVGVSGNTLTYNLTFDKDIKIADLPADFKTTMETTLKDAIDQAANLYPDLPSCTFVYNVINGVTGQTMLTVSKDYTAGD